MFDNFEVDEVFSDFSKIMKEKGHLETELNYTMPKGILERSNYSEISIQADLEKIAAKSGNDLYNIFTEDVMADAHPEGSTEILEAVDGLGEIETIQKTHEKMMSIVEKQTKIAGKVLRLSSKLDAQGFRSLAEDLDKKVASFLGKELSKEGSEKYRDLKSILSSALELVQATDTKKYLKDEANSTLEKAERDEHAAKKLTEYHDYLLKTLSDLGESTAYIALDKSDVKEKFDNAHKEEMKGFDLDQNS